MLKAKAKHFLFDTTLCISRYDMSAKVPSVGRAFNRDTQVSCLNFVYHHIIYHMHIHVIYITSYKL